MENANSSYKGFAYMRNSTEPKIIFGSSQEEIVKMVQDLNTTRGSKEAYTTCNIVARNPDTNQYEGFRQFDVQTGKDITKLYLETPKGLSKEEFQKTLQYFKENGARFNSYKKQWYIGEELQEKFRDYLPKKAGSQQQEAQKEPANNVSPIQMIESIDRIYVANLSDGTRIEINDAEILRETGRSTFEEVKAIDIVETYEKKIREYMLSAEYKEKQQEAPSVRDSAGLEGGSQDVHQNAGQDRLQAGSRVVLHVPDYQESGEGVLEIAGVKQVAGELQSITEDAYIVKEPSGKASEVSMAECYNEGQIRIMERAMEKGFSTEQLDLMGNPKLSAAQMEQVYNGLNDGLSSQLVAQYANASIEVWKMDLYRYGMYNGLSFYSMKEVLDGNSQKAAPWEDSRNTVDKMIKAQRNEIIKDLKDNGILPRQFLVSKMEKLNGVTGRANNIKSVMSTLREKGADGGFFKTEKGQLMQSIGREVKYQKTQTAKTSTAAVKAPVR